jgi:hypothetical protein
MALLKLRNSRETPNGGFRFPRDPSSDRRDEKAMITGGDIGHLVQRVAEYRIINELPLGDVRAEVEDWICRNVPSECVPSRPRSLAAGLIVRGAELARFVDAMLHWMTTADLVPQEEAERRAETCANCRFNQQLSDVSCAGCYGLAGIILRIIGNRKTRVDGCLAYCAICSCANSVQVFAPLDILNRAHKLSDFPTDIGDGTPCWKKSAEGKV